MSLVCYRNVTIIPGVVVTGAHIPTVDVLRRVLFLKFEDTHVARRVSKREDRSGGDGWWVVMVLMRSTSGGSGSLTTRYRRGGTIPPFSHQKDLGRAGN